MGIVHCKVIAVYKPTSERGVLRNNIGYLKWETNIPLQQWVQKDQVLGVIREIFGTRRVDAEKIDCVEIFFQSNFASIPGAHIQHLVAQLICNFKAQFKKADGTTQNVPIMKLNWDSRTDFEKFCKSNPVIRQLREEIVKAHPEGTTLNRVFARARNDDQYVEYEIQPNGLP
jgi:hypothetical protein